jgi:hypothetical protein
MDWFKCPEPLHYDGPGSSCPICDRIERNRYFEALHMIANEPAVMGPDGHWCQAIARKALYEMS